VDDLPSKSLELETRVSRLETLMSELSIASEVQTKRIISMQAQLDRLLSRISGF
jgi:uncharacterized coiled-coil protein SlyX